MAYIKAGFFSPPRLLTAANTSTFTPTTPLLTTVARALTLDSTNSLSRVPLRLPFLHNIKEDQCKENIVEPWRLVASGQEESGYGAYLWCVCCVQLGRAAKKLRLRQDEAPIALSNRTFLILSPFPFPSSFKQLHIDVFPCVRCKGYLPVLNAF